MKRKLLILFVLLLCMTGCGKDKAECRETDGKSKEVKVRETDRPEEEIEANTLSKRRDGTKEKTEREESETGKGAESIPEERPDLPHTGKELADFVPEGWEILDSVELDFDEDGVMDYVAVLETEHYWSYPRYPRILFAVASDERGGYRLDFQDINLIRTIEEGGIYGDSYLPMTAEETSFTTHSYGGSTWRWSEDYTYTYREGIWWLTSSEDIYGHFDYVTSYRKNDWDSGVGIRKKRSDSLIDEEENGTASEFDVVYEVSLEEPLTLEQAGKRWWLAPDRVTDWEVTSVTFGEEAEIPEDKVKLPDEAYIEYCDEDCVLYTVSDRDENLYYLAMYRWEDKTLFVPVKEESEIDDPRFYKGKIYYSAVIEENAVYRAMQDGEEQITKKDIVGIGINRIEPDGTGKETVFEYRYPKAEQEIVEDRIPYLSLNYEISRDEIVAEVYIGDEPHPFYRMKTDGGGLQKIGQMP